MPQKVLGIDLASASWADNGTALVALGRRDELLAWGRSWSSMAPTPVVLRALVRSRLGAGDTPGAIAIARDAVSRGPVSYALPALAWALSSSGDYASLESELRGREPDLQPRMRYVLAHALAAQGRRAEALRTVDALAQAPASEEIVRDAHLVRATLLADGDAAAVWAQVKPLLSIDPRNASVLAPYLARLGDLAHAEALAANVEQGSATHELYLAAVEWRTGRPDVARARLRALEAREPLPRAQVPPSFLRGEIAADEGLDSEAVEALRDFQRLAWQGGIWRSWAYPRSLFLLARSLERLGRLDEARAELERLLTLWAHADAKLPLLQEARALEAQLGRTR